MRFFLCVNCQIYLVIFFNQFIEYLPSLQTLQNTIYILAEFKI